MPTPLSYSVVGRELVGVSLASVFVTNPASTRLAKPREPHWPDPFSSIGRWTGKSSPKLLTILQKGNRSGSEQLSYSLILWYCLLRDSEIGDPNLKVADRLGPILKLDRRIYLGPFPRGGFYGTRAGGGGWDERAGYERCMDFIQAG